MSVQRVASVIKLRPEKEAEYRALHANVWPHVLETLKDVGIANYSIFLRDGVLFSYLEFDGEDFAAASAKIALDEVTQKWWNLTDPCQESVDTARPGEWWAPVEEVFHLD